MMRRGNTQQQKLPTKTCPVCNQDFVWRKKWERDWDRVKYCSKACAKQAKSASRAGR
ncbi:MAG: DUF2256 domain-containing protein [Planctomycetota bacterium]